MNSLVQYEQMRVAVAACARIDEAAEMRDKAAALAAYARQRDDTELDVWMSEIRLRATIRIGELVRELDKAQGARTDIELRPSGGKKSEAIADAGLTRSTAHRYEELAGGREERGIAAAKAAADAHFAQARQEQKPATMEGLRGAIKDAVVATLGPPPPRPKRPPVEPVNHDFIDFYSAVRPLAEEAARFNAEELANQAEPALISYYLDLARRARDVIGAFVTEIERRHPNGKTDRDTA